MIQKFKEKDPNCYMVRRLAKEEGIKDILYDHCLSYPGYIMDDYKELLPEYKDKIESIFLKYLSSQAKGMNKRSHYRHLTSTLWVYYTIYGLDKSQSIINDLKKQHPRKPALIDEINNLINKINIH